MALDDALTAFQQQLEAVRAAFDSEWADDDERDMALEDLGKARDWVEVEWLEHQLAAGDRQTRTAEERHGANSRPEPPETLGDTTTSSPDGW